MHVQQLMWLLHSKFNHISSYCNSCFSRFSVSLTSHCVYTWHKRLSVTWPKAKEPNSLFCMFIRKIKLFWQLGSHYNQWLSTPHWLQHCVIRPEKSLIVNCLSATSDMKEKWTQSDMIRYNNGHVRCRHSLCIPFLYHPNTVFPQLGKIQRLVILWGISIVLLIK